MFKTTFIKNLKVTKNNIIYIYIFFRTPREMLISNI